MARQVIQLPASAFSTPGTQAQWGYSRGAGPVIDNTLTSTSATRRMDFLAVLRGGATGRHFYRIQMSVSGGDLSDKWETEGGLTIAAAGRKLTVLTAGADRSSRDYVWTPSNQSEMAAFFNVIQPLRDRTTAATLTLFDSTIPEMKVNGRPAQEWKYSHPTRGTLEVLQAKINGVELL